MNNRAILGRICRESLLQQVETEIANSHETPKCSKQHYKRLSEILGKRVGSQNKLSMRLIVLMVAAALLLSACAVYIFRDKIKGLLIEYKDDHLFITADSESNENTDNALSKETNEMDSITEAGSDTETESGEVASIERAYVLNYIPEEYVLIKESINLTQVYYVWENLKGDMITYRQQVTMQGSYIDNKDTIVEIQNVNYEIFYLCSQEMHIYVWYDGTYYNMLSLDEDIDLQEVEQIILGIT